MQACPEAQEGIQDVGEAELVRSWVFLFFGISVIPMHFCFRLLLFLFLLLLHIKPPQIKILKHPSRCLIEGEHGPQQVLPHHAGLLVLLINDYAVEVPCEGLNRYCLTTLASLSFSSMITQLRCLARVSPIT